MKRVVYKERRTFMKHDGESIIGYLNEEELNDYQPENTDAGGEGEETWPVAFAYTGEEADGGTIMPCQKTEDYGEVANAIIRSKYSTSEELAIQRHAINGDYEENPAEYETYDEWCRYAVATAKQWFGIE